MSVENLTNPGEDPVDGDRIRVTYPNGATETKEYRAPVVSAPPLPFTATSAPLINRRAIKLLKQGKTNAALRLLNKD
jgi:hypothetical protein